MSMTLRSATHFLYPQAEGARFVLPLKERLASAALAFFLPARQRLWLEARRRWAQQPPALLDVESSLAWLRPALGDGLAQVAISLGTPGPYNKQTILYLGPEGEPRAIAKIGTTPAAIRLLRHEAGWLARLADHPVLCGHVPRHLAVVEGPEGLALVQSPGEGRPGARHPGAEHLRFLQALQGISPEPGFADSAMRRAMERRYALLRPQLGATWRARIEATLERIERDLPRDLPMGAAHRDFAPWNTRRTRGGLFVFDWEYASDGYLPLYDLSHFLIAPLAEKAPLGAAGLRRVIGRLMAAPLVGGAQAPDVQVAAYLLDLCLFYLESNLGDDSNDLLVQRYAALLDCHKEWSL